MSQEKEEESQAFLTPRQYLSVDGGIDHAGFGWAQSKLLGAAGAVFLTSVQAAHLGSLILPNLSCEWGLEKWQVLLLLGTGSLAMTLGGLIGNFASHAFGRRRNIIGGLLLMLLFGFTSAVQRNFYCYLTLRALSFIFFQFVSSSAVCAVLEVSPTTTRLAVNTVLTLAGQLGATCSAFLAMAALHSMGWRKLLFILYLPCFLPLIMFVMLDDSPKQLIWSGKPGEGRRAMSKMFKDNNKEDVTHLITWSRSKVERRNGFRSMLTPESERTTTVLLAVMTLKNLVITTLHTAIPYILQGNYNIYEDSSTLPSAQCPGISPDTLRSLTKGHIINIVITMSALSFSQLIGRSCSALLCYLSATTALLANIFWIRGQQGVILQMTMANSLVQGSRLLVILLLQGIYPPTCHGPMGEFFLSLGHTLSAAAPYLNVYVVVRHEVRFFVVYSVLFAVVTALLVGVSYIGHTGDKTEELYNEGFDWEVDSE